MAMVKLRVLESRFQADVWQQALESEGIPYRIRGNEDKAYARIFVQQKGFAVLYVEEKYLKKARELDDGLRSQLPIGGPGPGQITKLIDYTLLDPQAGAEDLAIFLDNALEMNCIAVCVAPWMIKQAVSKLAESDVEVCSVVDFPLGADSGEGKIAVAKRAVDQGATELDIVLNRGFALNNELDRAVEEIAGAAKAVSPLPVKVILETGALGEELSALAAKAFIDTDVAFVKTGTGFFGPATLQDVKILAQAVDQKLQIKAAGGISNLDNALEMIQAGASRLGSSKGYEIWQEAKSRWPEED